MKTDENGWNDCADAFHTSGAKCQAFRKRNDFWNDLQELPAKRPFHVERLAQGDPPLGVSLGTDSTSFPFHLFAYRGAVERFDDRF